MQVNVPHLEWRVLREVGRSKKPVVGSKLRLEMTRRTKDGSFLTNLVHQGLLKIEGKAKDPFEATYTLSERGKHAAEYGQFEIEWEVYKELSQALKR